MSKLRILVAQVSGLRSSALEFLLIGATSPTWVQELFESGTIKARPHHLHLRAKFILPTPICTTEATFTSWALGFSWRAAPIARYPTTACTTSGIQVDWVFFSGINDKSAGISTGYGFSEAPATISQTVVAFNDFHTLGQGRLSDMGMINLCCARR